jgi:2-amino-4-hydroxy-6-hydroxymethyldihydropteridine diphosphokinase
MDMLDRDGTARRSRLYRTPAFPPGAGPDFVNAAMCLPWRGGPHALLSELHRIEAAFGRTRATRWEARRMDLDLIALDDLVVPDPATQASWAEMPVADASKIIPEELIIPHPRLAERPFVLVPMADVALDWVHPVTGRGLGDLLAALPAADRAEVVALD